MKDVGECVNTLKDHIDREGLAASLELMGRIVKENGPLAIRPLLLIRPYHENDEFLDEMFTVIHTVEAFPLDVFIREFVLAIDDLKKSSPYLLSFMLGRLMKSEQDAVALAMAARKAHAETRRQFIEAIKEVRDRYGDRSDIARNADVALSYLA